MTSPGVSGAVLLFRPYYSMVQTIIHSIKIWFGSCHMMRFLVEKHVASTYHCFALKPPSIKHRLDILQPPAFIKLREQTQSMLFDPHAWLIRVAMGRKTGAIIGKILHVQQKYGVIKAKILHASVAAVFYNVIIKQSINCMLYHISIFY